MAITPQPTSRSLKIAESPLASPCEMIDLIHCNHFFCMPIAERLREMHGCPVVLDTHDVQSRQYVLRNAAAWCLPPRATYERMLKTELDWLRRADLLLHLNSEEEMLFRALLPRNEHKLLYPAVEPVPRTSTGRDFVLVASDNVPNVISVEWFLREVLPQADEIPLAIYGNIGRAIQKRHPALYKRFCRCFRGPLENIAAAYETAACVLLPTLEGHGLSIKTIEALSCGAPLIATQHAFRGINIDPLLLPNVTIANDAAGFASALRRMRNAIQESAGFFEMGCSATLRGALLASNVSKEPRGPCYAVSSEALLSANLFAPDGGLQK